MEEMNLSEIAIQIAEENQTRKILLILEKEKNQENREIIEKLEEKIKTLLDK